MKKTMILVVAVGVLGLMATAAGLLTSKHTVVTVKNKELTSPVLQFQDDGSYLFINPLFKKIVGSIGCGESFDVVIQELPPKSQRGLELRDTSGKALLGCELLNWSTKE